MRAPIVCLAASLLAAAACGTYHVHSPDGPPVGDTGDGGSDDAAAPDADGAAPAAAPPLGATPYPGGVSFRVWAPHAQRVFVVGDFNAWDPTADELAAEGGGIFGGNV